MARRLVRSLLLALSVVVVSVARGADLTCDDVGIPAPAVTTVFAAPNDTARSAWIVYPNCSMEFRTLTSAQNGDQRLDCFDRGIRHIHSIPTETQQLDIDTNPIVQDVFFNLTNYTTLGQVILAWSNLTSIDNFRFPEKLYTLDLDGNNMKGIASGTLPDKLPVLWLSRNKLTSLDNFTFPNQLGTLNLHNNSLTSVNFTFPSAVQEVHLDGNIKLKVIENVTLPNSLSSFTCSNCSIETFRGVQLPSQLRTLNFGGSTLKEFEIQQSDLVILTRVDFSGFVDQTSCKEPSANLTQIKKNLTACVISDDVFANKYLNIPLPTKVPGGSSTSPPSSSSSSAKTTIIVIVVVVVVVLLIVAVVVYRRCTRKRSIDDKYQDLSTAEAPTDGSSGNQYAQPEFVSNDIRNDEAFIAYRIAYDEIQIVRLIGKGGFGIIHLGRFRGEDVAVKQILPDRAKDMRVVRSFMDEIRLCVTLEHPSIVQFIGLMWSTLQDMAVVSEFMAGGDLHAALDRQPGSSPTEWFQASSNLKAKSSLALDVIVALVYLHSFDPPIIHRDLKAKNVLLNGEGDAKVSDFGTSREALLDETMTGEIGTVAWIAPEVLRGERYNEKADIYSLGVLLVELDTARHPYRKEISETDSSPHGNTRIALLVSSGRLKPLPSPECPSDIAPLITKCLSYDPQDRPSAMEIHYQMRKVVRARSG